MDFLSIPTEETTNTLNTEFLSRKRKNKELEQYEYETFENHIHSLKTSYQNFWEKMAKENIDLKLENTLLYNETTQNIKTYIHQEVSHFILDNPNCLMLIEQACSQQERKSQCHPINLFESYSKDLESLIKHFDEVQKHMIETVNSQDLNSQNHINTCLSREKEHIEERLNIKLADMRKNRDDQILKSTQDKFIHFSKYQQLENKERDQLSDVKVRNQFNLDLKNISDFVNKELSQQEKILQTLQRLYEEMSKKLNDSTKGRITLNNQYVMEIEDLAKKFDSISLNSIDFSQKFETIDQKLNKNKAETKMLIEYEQSKQTEKYSTLNDQVMDLVSSIDSTTDKQTQQALTLQHLLE